MDFLVAVLTKCVLVLVDEHRVSAVRDVAFILSRGEPIDDVRSRRHRVDQVVIQHNDTFARFGSYETEQLLGRALETG